MNNWPESTCAKCGVKMAGGQLRVCPRKGWCDWHIPLAAKEHIEKMQTAKDALVAALKHAVDVIDCLDVYDKYNPARAAARAALSGVEE